MIEAYQSHTLLKSIQSVLEALARLLALAATVCIALSVLFDWGYLSALDLRLSEVPTSLPDHARSAILWLPVAGFVLLLGVVFALFSDQRDARNVLEAKSRGEDTLVHATNEAKRAKRNLGVLAMTYFALWLAFGDQSRTFLFFAILLIWTLLVMRVTPITDGNWRFSFFTRLGLILPPFLATSLYFFGYNAGQAAIAPGQLFGTLTVRNSTGSEQMKGNIVRPFERFVIVIDENQKIILLKPDDIVRVERAGQAPFSKGLLCKYWQVACPNIPTHTP